MAGCNKGQAAIDLVDLVAHQTGFDHVDGMVTGLDRMDGGGRYEGKDELRHLCCFTKAACLEADTSDAFLVEAACLEADASHAFLAEAGCLEADASNAFLAKAACSSSIMLGAVFY